MDTPPPTEITPPPISYSNPIRLDKKVAIVTGGSSGLGRAICLAYHENGAKVVVTDLRPTSLDSTESEPTHEVINRLGGDAIFVKTDVTDSDSVDAVVEEAVRWGGRLDIMVNNAGVAVEGTDPQPIWSSKNSTWDKTLAVNGTGVFYGCRAAARQMIKQEPHACGDRGWIINLSSIYGHVGLQNHPAYTGSKHLVMGLTKSAAVDLAPHRVHVNAICPGFTESSMTTPHWKDKPENFDYLASLHPFGGIGKPEYIARAAVFLASEDAKWVHGHGLLVDGGFVIQ